MMVLFPDAPALHAEVRGVTMSWSISLETRALHMKQRISLPMCQQEVSEDLSHYAYDPERSLKRC